MDKVRSIGETMWGFVGFEKNRFVSDLTGLGYVARSMALKGKMESLWARVRAV